MIYFNIKIQNPFWQNRWANIKCRWGDTPWKNKHWEIQFAKCADLFGIEFHWTTKRDHAGINLELALLGYEINFTFYDSRHWDEDNNCWVGYTKS